MPNNREWAAFFWLAMFGIWALTTQRNVRTGIWPLLRTIAGPKILVPLICMIGWVSLEVWVGQQLRVWTLSLTTDTLIWFSTSALVLFGNSTEASRQPDFFRRKAIEVFGLALLVKAMVDYFVLPLPVELALQPMLAFLALLAFVASREDRTRQVTKAAKTLALLIGLGVLAHVALTIATAWGHIDKADLLREAILSIWLTLGLLPLIYLLALYSAYEQAFLWLGWRKPITRRTRFRCKLAMFVSFHFRVHELAFFGMPWQNRIAETDSLREAFAVIQHYRLTERERPQKESLDSATSPTDVV